MDWPSWIAGTERLVRKGKNKPRTSWEQLAALLGFRRIELVIDIGANRGQYAKSLRQHGYTGTIRSFEPLPDLNARLVEDARDDKNWLVEPPIVVGDRDGRVEFLRSAEDDMSSVLLPTELHNRISPSSAKTETVEAEQRRLDRLIDRVSIPTHLKIDVQGFESAVLDGAGKLMGAFTSVQLEMALLPLYRGENLWSEMIDRMDREGYDLHMLIPGYFERKLARQLQVDGIFVNRASSNP